MSAASTERQETLLVKDARLSCDEVFRRCVGDFGKWQGRVAFLMALLKLPIAWVQLGIIFLAPPTKAWCRAVDNSSTEAFDPCRTGCPDGVVEYDRSLVSSSIITEWGLICARERLVDLSQSALMFGVLVGNLAFSVLADKKGRRPALMVAIGLQALFGILTSFATSYEMFVVLRVLLAIANGGTVATSFVACVEVAGGKWRSILPILYQVPFGLGNSAMALVAIWLRDWRQLQLALSALCTVFLCYWWLVPESPRWLLAVGRTEEAKLELKKAAKINGYPVEEVEPILSLMRPVEKTSQSGGRALFDGSSGLRSRTLLVYVNWLVCGCSFYAFSIYLGRVSSDLHGSVVAAGFVAIPGTILCIFLVRHCGRRPTVAGAHLLSAVCFFGLLLLPAASTALRVSVAAVGVVCLSVSTPALYLYTGELFPTVVRNAAVGSAVVFSRIGSMLAPYVLALATIYAWLPLATLAGLALLEAVLVLPLPETAGRPLPDTIADAKESKFSENDINRNYEMTDRKS